MCVFKRLTQFCPQDDNIKSTPIYPASISCASFWPLKMSHVNCCGCCLLLQQWQYHCSLSLPLLLFLISLSSLALSLFFSVLAQTNYCRYCMLRLWESYYCVCSICGMCQQLANRLPTWILSFIYIHLHGGTSSFVCMSVRLSVRLYVRLLCSVLFCFVSRVVACLKV